MSKVVRVENNKQFKFSVLDRNYEIDWINVFNNCFKTNFKLFETYDIEFEKWSNNVRWFNHIFVGKEVIEIVEVDK